VNFKKAVYLIKSDLYRYRGETGTGPFLRNILFSPGFKYSFWMRVCAYLRQHNPFKYLLFPIAAMMLLHYRDKYGIDIPSSTRIGAGLHILHFGEITIHQNTIIGNNFGIAQGVTIGVANRGERQGTPTIGDNVVIAPGAKVFGNLKIGNNVAVGANCVVTKDIPDNAVVVGIPGKIISYKGSEGYVSNPVQLENSTSPD
jgi:serine O-acetyltransferase